MELSDVLLKRRSVRKFTEQEVSKEDINYLLHAAMSGPTAMNSQPWQFYVITEPKKLKQIHETKEYSNMNSPLSIIVCGDKTRMLTSNRADYWIQDCSAATENILLAATNIGLGAVWCGIFPHDNLVQSVSKTLELKENLIPLNIINIGHPAEEPAARDQYNEEFVHFVS